MPSIIGFMALKARDENVPFGFVEEDGEVIPWRYSKVSILASIDCDMPLTKTNRKHSS
jgi:hypothetical protein